MQRSHYKRPHPEASVSDGEAELEGPSKRRLATVYDAVAGKVFTNQTMSVGKHHGHRQARPDEVLFKRLNAPTRYEEADYYFAHTRLSPNQKLPNSDLLSALHAYVSKFYARSQEHPNSKVWKSMDETALIALGILIEETAKEILGETGDLAFLEAGDESAEQSTEEITEERTDESSEESSEESAEESAEGSSEVNMVRETVAEESQKGVPWGENPASSPQVRRPSSAGRGRFRGAATADRRKGRVVLSCYVCRSQKQKCDRVKPICGLCERTGRAEDCTWDPRVWGSEQMDDAE